jgi:hypothetical protein
VDLSSTGTTSLQGGSIFAAGSTVAIKGDISVAIQGTEISALNPTIGKPPLGSIAITGGSIKVGSNTGRTLLRAGDAQDLSAEENSATNLTLLDGGTGDRPAIKLQGGLNHAIEIYSVDAPPDASQGITTLRGGTEVTTDGGTISVVGDKVTNNTRLDPKSTIEFSGSNDLLFGKNSFVLLFNLEQSQTVWLTAKANNLITFKDHRRRPQWPNTFG